jgi:hypothetical protein
MLHSRLFVLGSLLVALPTVAACASIRVVSRSESGGTVALEGSPDVAREKAEDYMGSQCPFGYAVLPDLAPSAERELRISYRCKSPAGQPLASARQIVVTF